MNALTLAFKAMIQDAHTAERAYNRNKNKTVSPAVCLLSEVESQCAALREHLAIEAARIKANEVKQ